MNISQPLGISLHHIIRFCLVLITAGIVARAYDISAPWKTHDHYNFGGVHTTTYARCLRTTPLAQSKGVAHGLCEQGQADHFYRAHPPSFLFVIWGWTSIFGQSEASHRLLVMVFSVLNIFLVGALARRAAPLRPELPWLAMSAHAVFLGGLYFGTHLDFINEFVFFLVLTSAVAASRGRTWLACGLALLAGIGSWPGYLMFGTLMVDALIFIKRDRLRIFVMGAVAFAVAVVSIMWLHQKTNIVGFLIEKLSDPHYVKPERKGLLYPFFYARKYVSALSRLLGPWFFTLALVPPLSLGRSWLRSRLGPNLPDGAKPASSADPTWKEFARITWLAGGTGIIYSLIGHEYFVVHVFLFMFLLPAAALLSARVLSEILCANHFTPAARSGELRWSARISMSAVALATLSAYPFGIYKTYFALDLVASLFVAAPILMLLACLLSRHLALTPRWALVMMTLAFCGNLLEMINYRSEPDTERSFCIKAREEFERTGQPVHTREPKSHAKDLIYCRGIPIVYEGSANTN